MSARGIAVYLIWYLYFNLNSCTASYLFILRVIRVYSIFNRNASFDMSIDCQAIAGIHRFHSYNDFFFITVSCLSCDEYNGHAAIDRSLSVLVRFAVPLPMRSKLKNKAERILQYSSQFVVPHTTGTITCPLKLFIMLKLIVDLI